MKKSEMSPAQLAMRLKFIEAFASAGWTRTDAAWFDQDLSAEWEASFEKQCDELPMEAQLSSEKQQIELWVAVTTEASVWVAVPLGKNPAATIRHIARTPKTATRRNYRTYLKAIADGCEDKLKVSVGEVGLVEEHHITFMNKFLAGTGLTVDRELYAGTLPNPQ